MSCYNADMNEKNEFPTFIIKLLVAVALVVFSISAFMHVFSNTMEQTLSASEETTEEPYWVPEDETSVVNVLVSGAVSYDISEESWDEEENYTHVFDAWNTTLANYDFACFSMHSVANVQTPSALITSLYDTGFEMVGLAGMPQVNMSTENVSIAMDYWNHSSFVTDGLTLTDSEHNPDHLLTMNNVSCIYLSYTDVNDIATYGDYTLHVYNDETTPQEVYAASKQADLVIVSIQWDGEQGALPNDRQKEIAESLAGAGASIIIGDAENAVQPVAWIDDTLVFYSLGNFLTENLTQADRIGAIGAVTVTKTCNDNETRIELTNPRVEFTYTKQNEDGTISSVPFEEVSSEDFVGKDTWLAGYSTTIQSMDDSIRIGGLE